VTTRRSPTEIARLMRAAEGEVREAIEAHQQGRDVLDRPRLKSKTTSAHDVDSLKLGVEVLVEMAKTDEAIRPIARKALLALDRAEGLRWELAATMERFCTHEGRHLAVFAGAETDVAQEARLGAYEAAKRYDPDRGVTFYAYAQWWIRARLTRAAWRWRMLVMPAQLHERSMLLRKVETALLQRGRAVTTEALAEEAGVSIDMVRQVQEATASVESLDGPAPNPAQLDGDRTLGEVVPAPMVEVDEAVDADELAQRVDLLMVAVLTERQREVVRRRFGLDGEPERLEDIGRDWRVSRERVRQVQLDAMGRLRRSLDRGLHLRLGRDVLVNVHSVPVEARKVWLVLVLAGRRGLHVDDLAERAGLSTLDALQRLRGLRRAGRARVQGPMAFAVVR
jgi:RNA polymerase sigma factor (sigma-70 family)